MVAYNTNYLRATTRESFSKRDYEVFSNKSLNAHLYKNAYILPYKETNDPCHIYAGIVTEDNEYLEESAFHENIGNKYPFSDEDISVIDRCIYLGVIDNCWGHVITDALKKIWYINNTINSMGGGVKYAYITRYNKPLASHAVEILRLAGVDMSKSIHINKITKVNKLILPDNSLFIKNGQRFYTKEFKETIIKIKKEVQSKFHFKQVSTYKKLYFTRTQFNNLRDYGESAIENAFKERGFKIIAPEQLSPSEQIFLLMHCKEFATMSGSPAHSAEFCSEGTKFIDIRKADYWNTYQEVVNHLANLNVILIDAHNSSMVKTNAPWGGPFYIYQTPQFKNYCRKSSLTIPLILRPSWLRYRYKELLKDVYYNFRAKLGIKTRLKTLMKYFNIQTNKF